MFTSDLPDPPPPGPYRGLHAMMVTLCSITLPVLSLHEEMQNAEEISVALEEVKLLMSGYNDVDEQISRFA